MSDDTIGRLLREVADTVEPTDRLDAIRTATAHDGRRTGRGWWAASGVGLVAASVVTALALSTGGTPGSRAPDPAQPAPSRTTATDGPGPATTTTPVYYVGDTPDGPRLYREFRRMEGDPFTAAVAALSVAPVDPDYTTQWPSGGIRDVSFDGIGDEAVITVTVDQAVRQRPEGMSAVEAGLAVEQAVRTFQAAAQSRAPVQFRSDDNPIDQVFGVPTSEPLAKASDLSVLALVSLSDPSEGTTLDNDEPFTVTGVANSFEGTVVITVERLDDGEVLVEVPTIAGTYEDRLFPFEERVEVVDLPPGDYLVRARTDDPSGEGRFHSDSRRVTVVD